MSISARPLAKGGLPLSRQVRANLSVWLGWLRRKPRARLAPWLWSGRMAAGTMLTLIVVGVVIVTADARIAAYARTLPSAFHSVFRAITEYGKSGWFLWPIGLVLIGLCIATSQRIGRVGVLVVCAIAVRLTFVFAAIALPGLFVAIVKRMIGRARPFVDGTANPYLYDPFVWKAAYAGMPSGHATTAGSALVAIGTLWPRARPYLWIYALLIIASRVITSAHYPSDVIAGAAVGAVGAVLVRDWFAARGLAFSVDAECRVNPMPGPSWQRVKRAVAHLMRR